MSSTFPLSDRLLQPVPVKIEAVELWELCRCGNTPALSATSSHFRLLQGKHQRPATTTSDRPIGDLHRRLVRSTRAQAAEAWSIVNPDDERRGEVTVVWGEPHPYCLVVLDDDIEVGGWEQVIYRLEQEILVEEPGVVSYAVWHKGFVGEYYRCADCGELHSQFDEDAGTELRLDDLDPPEER